MIKIPTLFLIFVISFLALYAHQNQVFAQNATNTTTVGNTTMDPNATTTTSTDPNVTATTTMEPTNTTTTTMEPVVAGNITFAFPSYLYVGQSSWGTISLTRAVADGKELIVRAWLQDNSSLDVSPLQTVFSGSASGTDAWVSLHAVAVPSNSYVMWDWSILGNESGFAFIPDGGYTSIEIRPLMSVWVSGIPVEITNGTTITFSVTLSGAPPQGYITVMPSFNAGMNGFFNTSTLTFMKGDNTTWTQGVSFTATELTMNASAFMFQISGMDSYAYNTTIMGLPSRGTSIVEAPTTTTSTMAPNTTTMAPNTTTMAPNTTTMAPNTTTMAPNTTTMAPNTTTMAPNTTTMAPNTTTMAPNTTTTTTMPPTTTTMAPSTTVPTTTMAPTTMAPETTSTAAPLTINPSNPPPAWFDLVLSSVTTLSESERQSLISKLATILRYPANQISLGAQSASGSILVVLNAPTDGAVNTTAIAIAKAAVNNLDSSQLDYLGAASMAQGTTAAPGSSDSAGGLSTPALIGIVVGGVVLIAIILFIVKVNSSQGTGVAAADNSPSRPLSNMEKEMNQHQQQQQHRQQQQQPQGRYIDNEL